MSDKPTPIISTSDAGIHAIQQQWNTLMALLMWGDIGSDQVGRLTRARKRLLDTGEAIQSFFTSKDWISQPRQQLKSALGSSVRLRDSLEALQASCKALNRGADLAQFNLQLAKLQQTLLAIMVEHENRWALELDALACDEE